MADVSARTCSIDSFEFYDSQGSTVNGTLDKYGQCIFPNANCGPGISAYDCCKAKDEYKVTGSKIMYIAFAFIFIPIFYLKYFSKTAEEREARARQDEERLPSWVKNLGPIKILFGFGLKIYIVMQVLVPIWMRSSIQEQLDVGSRNAVIAAEAFLIPYNEIFQFIEDIILVRVNYAIGHGQKTLTNQLVHLGLVGALMTGIAAAIIGTILGAIPPVLSALTIPGAAVDQQLYPGCDNIVDSTDGILPYWMIEVWAIPGTQAGMVLTGFMLGAMELDTVGWIGGISLAMIPIIWFAKSGSASNTILVLGGAEFTAAWCLPILSTLYMTSPLGRDLRANTGVTLQFSKLWSSACTLICRRKSSSDDEDDDAEPKSNKEIESGQEVTYGSVPKNSEGDTAAPPEQPAVVDEEKAAASAAAATADAGVEQDTSRTLLFDGLKIMFMDVAIQFCISLSIYLALVTDGAVAYQLTALQSALPTYGFAYAIGLGVMFKIAGPQLIAVQQYDRFVKLARLTILMAVLLVPLIFGAVVPFVTPLAYDYGENACEYAKDGQCVPFFTKVFGPNSTGGEYTLSFTFDAFAVGASIEAVFLVLRATMLALIDLDYMVKCTILAVVIYIPVIIVATTVEPFAGQAVAFFTAMYIPQFVLIILFLVRFEILIRRISRGQKGTWVTKSARSSVKVQSG